MRIKVAVPGIVPGIKNNARLLSIIVFISFLIFPLPMQASSVLNMIDLGDGAPYKILPGIQGNDYWVVTKQMDFVHLIETQPNIWQADEIEGVSGYDACGPDSNGKIYISTFSDEYPGGGFQVFNTSTVEIEDTVILSSDCPVSGITISPDETKLYLLGLSWPKIDQGSGFGQGWLHPDSGIVWEVDLTSPSYPIRNQGITAALPETIYYHEVEEGNDKLYIYCSEIHAPNIQYAILDVHEISRALPRIDQIHVPEVEWYYHNNVVRWSEDCQYLALCSCIIKNYPDNPEYLDGLWIIDTESGQIVETIPVISSYDDYYRGVSYAFVSEVNPGYVYISPASGGRACELITMDITTHEVVDYLHLDNYGPSVPFFIYEIPDGRLIVTTAVCGKILIIDPT
jgi:hypothetical protein